MTPKQDDKTRNPFRCRNVKKIASVSSVADLPEPLTYLPEVALVGRSNVGKSTLLNALLSIRNKKHAAAVGDRPGVTQSLDFYRLGPIAR